MLSLLFFLVASGNSIPALGSLPSPWTKSDLCSIAALRPSLPVQTIGYIDDPDGKYNSKPLPNDIRKSANEMTNWPILAVHFLGRTMKSEFGKCPTGPERLNRKSAIHLAPNGKVAWVDLGTTYYTHGRISGASGESCMFEKQDRDWVTRGCVDFGMILT